MKIAIASWVNVSSLNDYFDHPVPKDLAHLGAPATAVTNIIKGLHELGHEIIVYTLDFRTEKRHIFKGERITFIVEKERHRARYKLWDGWKFETDQIAKLTHEFPADIYHAHWSYEYALGLIKAKVPHLITFRDDSWEILKYFKDVYRLGKFNLDRRVRAKGENFSVNSMYLQQQLSGFRKQLPIVPNPVNPHCIQPKARPFPQHKTIKIISILTGFQKRKNPKKALEAFSHLKKIMVEDLEFHIYGSGFDQGQAGYEWALAHQLTDKVTFHGYTPYDQLIAELPNYDLLFHPALEESFGNTLLEGMAFGIPVVAGQDAGAVPWVLAHGDAGQLVDVHDAKKMAEGIKSVLMNKEVYERLTHAGLARIHNTFATATIAQKYVDLYDKILKDIPLEV